MKSNGLLRTGLLVLLIISCIGVVSAASRVVQPGGTVYIGETTLDITDCVSGNTIGWWGSAVDRFSTAPSKEITITNRDKRSFSVDPSDFIGYTGDWYNYNSGEIGAVAFTVAYSQPGMPNRFVPAGGDVVIGEKGLEVTNCVSGNAIAWWAGPSVGAPSIIMSITNRNKQSFFVDPSQFNVFNTGNWYNYNSLTGEIGTVAFNVVGSQPGTSDRLVPIGGEVIARETNLDISYCVSGNTIAWWMSIEPAGAPSAIMTISNKDQQSFSIDLSQFGGHGWYWYNYNPRTGEVGSVAFKVIGVG